MQWPVTKLALRINLTIMPSAKGFASSLGRELDGPFDAAGRRGGQRIGDGIDQGGRRGVAAAGGSLGKIFVGAFAAMGAANIVSSVVGFFNEAVGAASDLAETQSKAGEIFGEATDTIIEKSREAAATLGQSQQVYLDGASTFGIFGQAAGLAGNDLATFSTDMVTLATDLASFNNTSPEQAIQAIGAALRRSWRRRPRSRVTLRARRRAWRTSSASSRQSWRTSRRRSGRRSFLL